MRAHTGNLAVRRLIERARHVPPRHGRPAKPPHVPFPGAAERRYQNVLLAIVERMLGLIESRLLPRLPRIAAEVHALLPAKLDDWVSETQAILADILGAVLEDTGDADSLSLGIAQDISEANEDGFRRQLKVVFGTEGVQIPQPWLRTQMKSFAAENAKLIKSIPEQYLGRVEQMIQKEFRAGTDVRKLATMIQETFDVPRRRAKTIARDQVGSLNGTLTQLRNQEMGLAEYEWLTAGDERVRPSHQERDGKIFRWDKPPPDGNPGQPINCRCTALPVVIELVEQMEATA